MSKTNLGLSDKALAAMTADELAAWVKLGSEALRSKLAEANKPALLARRRAYERSRREKTVGVSFRLVDKRSAEAVRRVVRALAAASKSSGRPLEELASECVSAMEQAATVNAVGPGGVA